MGALALARHQFHEALEWGERARQINPDRTYAYGVIADAQIELGRYDEAVQTLQMMVDLRPDMNSYTRISYIRELYGDTDGALDMMRRAVEGGVPGAESTAWTRTQLANLYFNLGQLEPAEAEYQHALAEKPGYLYALAGLGRVRAAQGRTDEAIALLNRASQTMPLPEFVITLGDIYLAAGQPQMAQQQYDLLAVIQQLYQANSVDLELEMALFKADHRQDLAATVAQARQVFERRPSIHAADALAWALYQAGDYREAQSFAQQALRLGTKDALKLFHAGMITYRLGDEPQARDYLERALQINPHFSLLYADEARRILEKLQK
jgi:tetratricopeptide (TPR) repeat protein